MYRGYVYAQQAGTYTFSISSPDDYAAIWVGDTAKRGWTKANILPATSGNTATAQFTAPIEGTYIPIRIVYANAAGAMSWQLTMTNVYGQPYTVGTSAATASNNIVRYSCDGTTAPAFPNPIGQEDSGPNDYVPTPTPCNNTGLEYGSFVHNQYASGASFSAFNPGFMKATNAVPPGVGTGTPTSTSGAQ